MLVAVSRDDSMLAGGISSSEWTGRGTVDVEPIAHLTATGSWIDIPCSSDNQKNCVNFAHHYLSKPHTYTIVSAGGKGVSIHAQPTTLSECFDYSGTGTYSGGIIERSGTAANSTTIFAEPMPVNRLKGEESLAVRSLLAGLVPKKLDSTQGVQVFEVQLEGKSFFVVQRAFSDLPNHERRSFIFGFGVVIPHAFDVLYWKKNTEDENERILGTIALKSDREFLISVVNHPEGHFYRVYGIRDDHLALIYSGGGSSC